MHRFYLPPQDCAGGLLHLGGREAHHARRVLRLKCGDPAVVLDGAGMEWVCQVEDAARNALTLRVMKRRSIPAPLCAITLLQALPKRKVFETIIQKAAEMGARRIVPILSGRVVVRLDGKDLEHKRCQWSQVAIEAIKQCGAAWLPEVEAPATLQQFVARNEKFDLALVGSLQSDRRHPRDCFQEFERTHGRLPRSVAIWIGPEGDFAPGEMAVIQQSGALPISLGGRVLRVETAATYCLSILNYEMEHGHCDPPTLF
ncbi:MAG: 16S rRNA (uracil(1498)-N(3))-methyltransferase [Verrucomicrobiota bacterium]|nr:16S rRNA (uracil(1498)-N(3))-methyltransferase [Verrucomicrobiota bacterium]